LHTRHAKLAIVFLKILDLSSKINEDYSGI
jgi:hypothetical protein